MFIVGADIGQAQDPTALAVVETAGDGDEVRVRHLERLPLGTPYPQVVARIVATVAALPDAALVVDATGCGRPVADQLRAAGLDPVAVTITAGKAATFDSGTWHVPKRELVRALVVAFEGDRLKIAADLRYAKALMGELQAYRRKITGAGRAAYGATAGAHDDLVIAVALAVWWAAHQGRTAGLVGPHSPAGRDLRIVRGFRRPNETPPPTAVKTPQGGA